LERGWPGLGAEWLRPALEAVASARVTLVLGDCDTGKTSLVAALAGTLAAGDGAPVAVVDADLGQSEIGPPTTVGLGRVAGPLRALREAEPLALEFVGATSPAHHLAETVEATRRLVAWARAAGFGRILVDTSGLVAGALGRALKRPKIGAVAPDIVLALERAGECAHVLAGYDGAGPPRIVRLAAAPVRRRSAEERQRHRARALEAYFAGARTARLDLGHVTLRGPSPVAGVLVGLGDAGGATLGLGRLRALDADGRALTLETPVDARRVAAVLVGREPA
jgi:polynucleotide 5'-hydroxyl-kinase GRC3/NOL9